jgi:hypothetical protein
VREENFFVRDGKFASAQLLVRKYFSQRHAARLILKMKNGKAESIPAAAGFGTPGIDRP